MNKIAIISDIHGNKTALEAVLSDAHLRNVDKIYCLGDSVTKCANPDVVIDLLQHNCDIVLKGNCDDTIAKQSAYDKKFWSRMKIGESRANYLNNLPVIYEFYLSGHLIRIFHASPFNLSSIYNPMFLNKTHTSSSTTELNNPMELFYNTDFIGKTSDDPIPDIVGYGHIHTSNFFRFKNKTIFNPGSVGVPIEMENVGCLSDKTNRFSTVASYTILEGILNSENFDSISINMIRVPYNIEQEILDIEHSDMPGKEKIIFNLKTASSNF